MDEIEIVEMEEEYGHEMSQPDVVESQSSETSCTCCGCSCKINITLLSLGVIITFLQSLSVGLQDQDVTSEIVSYVIIVLSASIVALQALQLGLKS